MATNWGGSWTEEKLEVFEKYVNAYLSIMHSNRKKFGGWPRTILYIDGFAGSGTRGESDKITESSQTIFFPITDEEKSVYQGSPERVLKLKMKFDRYIFIDKDASSLDSLKKRLQEKELITNNCIFIKGDLNNELIENKDIFNNKDLVALIFLDPFGMNVKWKTIESFSSSQDLSDDNNKQFQFKSSSKKRIDLWILLPSGVIVNRLLDRKGNLKHIKKLTEFFGMTEDEIKSIFYQNVEIKDSQLGLLFDSETDTNPAFIKSNDSINKIRNIYVQQLKKVFNYVTEEPLVLKNNRNVPIYHFVFASNNKIAWTIADQIIKKRS